MSDDKDTSAPPLSRLLRESLTLPKLAAASLRKPPAVDVQGDGEPVLVIPGMLSGDASTALLRRALRDAGYRSYRWKQGFNNPITEVSVSKGAKRLKTIVRNEERPVVIIGWSLGGFFARLLARRHPDIVSLVITLGTPFSGDRHANNAWRLYEFINGYPVDDPPLHDDLSAKPQAYTIAFWSPLDGIVAPASARGLTSERDEAIELPFRHFEMGVSRRSVAKVVSTLNERRACLVPYTGN